MKISFNELCQVVQLVFGVMFIGWGCLLVFDPSAFMFLPEATVYFYRFLGSLTIAAGLTMINMVAYWTRHP